MPPNCDLLPVADALTFTGPSLPLSERWGPPGASPTRKGREVQGSLLDYLFPAAPLAKPGFLVGCFAHPDPRGAVRWTRSA